MASYASLNAAEVRGRITDEAGFTLPGAVITIKSLPSGSDSFQGKSARDGSFVLRGIPFGRYRIEASLAGFVTVGYEPLDIQQLVFRWDFKLPLGAASEGGVFSKAQLVGTLQTEGIRIGNVSVCFTREARRVCTTSNDLGEYEISLETGKYTVEVRDKQKVLWTRELDFPTAREYKDAIRF